jgi:thioester reductase-like protein
MNCSAVLLTGATGFLGRFLMRELLAANVPVVVLVRDHRGRSAQDRVDETLAFASETLGRAVPAPLVVNGDLAQPDLGLDRAERNRLQSCRSVVHAAASVTLRPTAYGEPWNTNVEGTQRLLDFCRTSGVRDFHHVSTAFVCGKRTGIVPEDEPADVREFHNEYERSKWEAERCVRSQGGDMRATMYRPSLIVGDSTSGYTCSYHGFYRFLELGDRLAVPASGGRRMLSLRLPFGGEERRNLVPVDWVARAIVHILMRPSWHGRTYHLTSPDPVRGRLVKEVGEQVLGIDGVTCAEPESPAEAGTLEQTFLDNLQEYWPYRGDDPDFDCRNTVAALPDLPCPRVDRELLARLIRFAVADRWGRASRQRGRPRINCAEYVERFFPAAAAGSTLAQLALDVDVGLDVRGAGGGLWTVRFRPQQAASVRRGGVARAAIVYRTDVATFAAIVRGRRTPHEAFLERRIDIGGDVEKGLKLAVLFDRFLRECPYPRQTSAEQTDAVPVAG